MLQERVLQTLTYNLCTWAAYTGRSIQFVHTQHFCLILKLQWCDSTPLNDGWYQICGKTTDRFFPLYMICLNATCKPCTSWRLIWAALCSVCACVLQHCVMHACLPTFCWHSTDMHQLASYHLLNVRCSWASLKSMGCHAPLWRFDHYCHVYCCLT